MALTIGVDIGGTKIAAGAVDEQGKIVEKVRRNTPAESVSATEDAVADAVAEIRSTHEVEAVGVGAAGFVDSARATVLFAPNLAWRNEPLRAELEERIGLPVVIENDANAAAWGEFTFGAGHDVDDLLLVTLGTGIGGGLVLDGQLHRGAFGVAAEVGHMRVVPAGRLCPCGNRGCWERYASGTALEQEAREVASSGSPQATDLLERAGGDPMAIEGKLVTTAAREGDGLAQELLETVGRWLGEGIASLAAVLDPAVAVIGGGVSEAGDLLLEPARHAYRAQLTGRRYRPELDIRPAQLGNQAGIIGAADLARS